MQLPETATVATRRQCAATVLAAGLTAQVAAWAAHALSPILFVAAMVTLTASSLLAGRITHRSWMPLAMRFVAVACTAGVAWKVVLHPGPDALHTAIAPLVVVLQSTHALMATRIREWRISLLIAGALLLVAAGVADGASVAVPLVLGQAVLVAGNVMIRRQALVERAAAVATPVAVAGPSGRRFGSPWSMVAGASVAATVAGLAVFLIVPTSPALGLRSRLAGHVESSSDPTATRTSLGVGAYVGDEMLSLDLRGSLPDDPVLSVPEHSPQL